MSEQQMITETDVGTIDVGSIQTPAKDVLKRAASRRRSVMAELAALGGRVKGIEDKLEAAKKDRDERSVPLAKELAELNELLAPHLSDLRREAQEAHDAKMAALA